MRSGAPDPPASETTFESVPLTRPEYINAMVHFYRGELSRSQAWRNRIDTTTNWAVLTTAGMVSFAFSSPEHSPFTLVLANVLIATFLWIEARRYRYFTVFRARVRMIEENFFLPLLRRDLVSPKPEWREMVARDLDRPRFRTTRLEATLFRLRRNYIWLFGIIFLTWVVKLFIHPTPARSVGEMVARMGIGPISSWLVLGIMFAFYVFAVFAVFSETGQRAATDEITDFDRELVQWERR
jgi:uncharacterized membrane protein